MALERSHARLGFFLVVSLVVVLATTLFFVQRLRDRPVVALVTYISENVAGLDVASPVLFRGVAIGEVDAIRVDPQEARIEVNFELFLDRLLGVGFDMDNVRAGIENNFPNLRARVVGNPVTGDSYLLLDLPPDPPPPTALGFEPPRPYVAAMPSPLAQARDRLPDVLERAETMLSAAENIVTRLPGTLDRADLFFTNVEQMFQASEFPELSADARRFFASTTAEIAELTADVETLLGERGAVIALMTDVRTTLDAADLAATTETARTTLDRTTLAADDLRQSLPAIRDTLGRLQELGRLLEAQPESVVYGPRPAEESR